MQAAKGAKGGRGVINSSKLQDVVRTNIETLCEHFFPKGKKEGYEWKIADTSGGEGNSLGIDLRLSKAGVWHDRATGEGGDFVELLRESRNLSFLEAVGEIEKVAGASLKTATYSPRKEKPKDTEAYQLSNRDRELMMRASVILRKDPKLVEQVRSGLPLDAVEQVAVEGDLGFVPNLRMRDVSGPAILFGYSHGIKARFPGKIIRWYCGNAGGECWRQSLLLSAHKKVYIAEGEPAALRLISLGYDAPGESLVVGLASASTIPRPEAFAGKDLILIPDGDEAGRRCVEKFRADFGRIVRSLRVVVLETDSAKA